MKEEKPAFYKRVQLYRIVTQNGQSKYVAGSTELFVEEEAYKEKKRREQADSEGMTYEICNVALNLGSIAAQITDDTVFLLSTKSIDPFFINLPFVVYRRPETIEDYLHRVVDSTMHMISREAFMIAKQTRHVYARAIAKHYTELSTEEQVQERNALSIKYYTLLNGFGPKDYETPQLRAAMKEHALVTFAHQVLEQCEKLLNEEDWKEEETLEEEEK